MDNDRATFNLAGLWMKHYLRLVASGTIENMNPDLRELTWQAREAVESMGLYVELIKRAQADAENAAEDIGITVGELMAVTEWALKDYEVRHGGTK